MMRIVGLMTIYISFGILLSHDGFPHHHAHVVKDNYLHKARLQHESDERDHHPAHSEHDDITLVRAKKTALQTIPSAALIVAIVFLPVLKSRNKPKANTSVNFRLTPLLWRSELSFRGPPVL